MKKMLSLLLALTLLLSISGVAIATTAGQLTEGDNTIELPWDTREPMIYTYTATQTGTLYIANVEFLSAIGDYDYTDNTNNMYEWQDCTEFTVDGQLLEGFYYGSVEVVEGQTYTFSWKHGADVADKTWYKLGFKAVINLSYASELVPKYGSEELPVELYPADCPTDSIEIPAGGSVWYNLYEFNDAEFLVTGENAYIKATVMNMDTFAMEEVYEVAKNGVATMLVSGWRVLVEIGNSGTEPAVFQLNYRYPLGSENNPDTLVMGENVAEAEPGGFEGYTYAWTAQCDGVLTLTMPQSNWTVIVYNMTEGDEGVWFDAPGENVITIEVKKGELFWINLNNFNELTETFLGGKIKFTASVAYAHSYVDGVCEHCGAQEATFVQGDANGDGKVNARDARLALRYAAKLIGDGELNVEAADINGDGKVNARDARIMLRKAAGLE